MEEQVFGLFALLQEHTIITQDGFSISLAADPYGWNQAIQKFGTRKAYQLMADRLCELYLSRFGEEFLFRADCIAFEIAFHADAFFSVSGFPGYHRNIATLPYRKDDLIRHCKEIDISVQDVSVFKQRLIFHYRRGIRDCYKHTPRDPFFKKT